MAGLLDKLKEVGKKKDEKSSIPKDTPLPTDGGSPVDGGEGGGGDKDLPPGVTPVGGGEGAGESQAGGAASQAKLLELEAKTQEIDSLKEQLGEIEEKSKKLEVQVTDTEKITKKSKEKLDEIDKNMKKFLSLYEMVTNQINPFVESKSFERPPASSQSLLSEMEEVAPPAPHKPPEEEYVVEEVPEEPEPPNEEEEEQRDEPKQAEVVPAPQTSPATHAGKDDDVLIMEAVHHKDNSLALKLFASMVDAGEAAEKKAAVMKSLVDLGWLTPKAHADMAEHLGEESEETYEIAGGEEGEGPRTPLSDEERESLAPLLKWIDGLVDRVGVSGATDILQYLVGLGWVTPDAHEELLRYIGGAEGGDGGPDIVPLEGLADSPETAALAESWMRYLIDKVGEERAREVLTQYRDFGWLSRKAQTQLEKAIDELDEIDKFGGDEAYELSSADHATSLFFISRIKGIEDADDMYEKIERILGRQGFAPHGEDDPSENTQGGKRK